MPARAQSNDSSSAVLRPLHALEALAAEDCTPASLGKALGIHAKTSRRILEAMSSAGFVSDLSGEGGPYRLTPRLAAIGQRALGRLELPQVAHGYLLRLSEDFGEAAFLAIPHKDGMLTIVDSLPARRVFAQVGLGDIGSYRDSAAGRVVLAHDANRLEATLHPEEPGTKPPPDPAQLLVELTVIRDAGYAALEEDPEEEIGVLSVAAPVRDMSDAVVGAIAISAPASRAEGRIEELGVRLIEAASALSLELGSPASLSASPSLGGLAG